MSAQGRPAGPHLDRLHRHRRTATRPAAASRCAGSRRATTSPSRSPPTRCRRPTVGPRAGARQVREHGLSARGCRPCPTSAGRPEVLGASADRGDAGPERPGHRQLRHRCPGGDAGDRRGPARLRWGTHRRTHRRALAHATNPLGLTAIGDGVEEAHDLLAPETSYDVRATIVFTEGHETAEQYISDVSSPSSTSASTRSGLGTADEIQPTALTSLTNGTGGYLLLTGQLGNDDTSRFGLVLDADPRRRRQRGHRRRPPGGDRSRAEAPSRLPG